jgi:hypothetical protein
VSTPQEDLQQGFAAGFAAWGTMVAAWTSAFTQVYNTVLEWAVDEKSLGTANSATVPVYVHHATALIPRFHRVADPNQAIVPAGVVVLSPGSLTAAEVGQTVLVKVCVPPVAGMQAGAYKGQILDANGSVVKDKVYVPAPVPGPP